MSCRGLTTSIQTLFAGESAVSFLTRFAYVRIRDLEKCQMCVVECEFAEGNAYLLPNTDDTIVAVPNPIVAAIFVMKMLVH